MEKRKITALNIAIRLADNHGKDFMCITDIARYNSKEPGQIVRNYLRNKSNIDFLGAWEKFHNENFNYVEFDVIRSEVGSANFTMSAKEWIERTNAVGLTATAGRHGGTFAHSDIALQFTTWLNPEFYLYVLKDYQRIKEEESNLLLKQWDLRRELSKASYAIQTDAIREYISPVMDWNTEREVPIFASEADLLNQAVFGMTAKEFKIIKPDFKGNLRDFATTEQLEIINGLQHLNAGLIEQGLTQTERFQLLRSRAKKSLEVLESNQTFQKIVAGASPKKLKS